MRRRHLRLHVPMAVLLTTTAACGGHDPEGPRELTAAHEQAPITRTAGNSRIGIPDGDPDGAGAILRGCPAATDPRNDQGGSVTCLPVERLADRTLVTMRCWLDATGPHATPAGFHGARWFYVTDVDGPHPGYSGYLYSELIPRSEQIRTPHCDDGVLAAHPFYGPGRPAAERPVLKVVGSCTPAGGELTSRTSGFEPGEHYFVSADYPDGATYKNLKSEVVARPDGTVPWTWPCEGDPPGTYRTSIDNINGSVGTGDVHFTIGAAPVAPSTAPPKRPERTIIVHNKVTNGATAMREDRPAYLSTVTRNYCRRDGCEVPGTEMSTGAALTATCQVGGARTTNGSDGDAADDANPGLFSSIRWYRVSGPAGRSGYISEVWIRPGDRGGLGLPTC